ncbi:MAG: hypothetical protein F6K50_06210 [Moorea sp. SIO3I7]|nr:MULTISPECIES: hypothetical protein [unclassified Moorena]NEN95133.1 hypothetical protein [Moorena sp. SIO3I7]NEO05739.1 hypothetical protein [Moorena sp. SIO3I8]NEO22805.1 hypothetical protein [Moorena sp. SIO4A5]NEP21156.1 hypothetical protein [Moorena sp. SIO3I6]
MACWQISSKLARCGYSRRIKFATGRTAEIDGQGELETVVAVHNKLNKTV